MIPPPWPAILPATAGQDFASLERGNHGNIATDATDGLETIGSAGLPEGRRGGRGGRVDRKLGGALFSADTAAEDLVAGKSNRLIVLSQDPKVLETPLELLTHDRVTPKELLFVRNNQELAGSGTLKPLPLKGWEIEFAGITGGSRSIDAGRLAKLEQVEHEMVLQCSGNSRSLFAKAVKSKGTQWGRGGMGNVRFAGPSLFSVLKEFGVTVPVEARFLTAEGRDRPAPDKADFEHSIPLGDALHRSILAIRLNGEPLPAAHGGPVRLVTPGYFGTMNIKWLSRLRFDKTETDNYNQIPRYRVPVTPIKPGQAIEYTFANSRPNWRMKVKSVVLTPAPGAELKRGQNQVQGVAFNDGAAKIDAVLVSTDKGQTWRRAKLESPASRFAWYRWSAAVDLPAGDQQIWSRAIDAFGAASPLMARFSGTHPDTNGTAWKRLTCASRRAPDGDSLHGDFDLRMYG